MLRAGCVLFALSLAAPALAQMPAAPPAPAPAPPPAPGQTSPTDRAASAAAERQATLDRWLKALQEATTEQDAAPLEARVRQLWLNAGTPAVTLLLGRGLRELKAGDTDEAIRDFQAALDLDADSVEAWHQLAQARFTAGDMVGAVAAIGETLRREPRHFAALQTLSRFAEAREDWRGAYDAWNKAMEIAPKLEGGETKLKDLKRRALGDET